jgi:hypothetical protein
LFLRLNLWAVKCKTHEGGSRPDLNDLNAEAFCIQKLGPNRLLRSAPSQPGKGGQTPASKRIVRKSGLVATFTNLLFWTAQTW